MAAYTYKYVRDLLPQHVKDQVIDYDSTCDYDGDQWSSAEYLIFGKIFY